MALSMASQLCQKTVSVQDIMDEARKRDFTKVGEMFDANHLCQLANHLLNDVDATVEDNLLERPNDFSRSIVEGNLLLVP